MKISSLKLTDFMIFDQFEMKWSNNINVICGSNSTGKTVLLKLMYSLLSANQQTDSKSEPREKYEARFVEKITHVFRSEDMWIGRLARRKQGGSRAEGTLVLENDETIHFGFGNQAKSHMDLVVPEGLNKKNAIERPVYFPPKEIISATENFRSLYDEYHIAFEETYYDLACLLDRPLKKGKNTEEQKAVLDSLGDIMKGTIVAKDNKFYLKVAGQGEFEMGLVSEGYRKLATIVYLILNGTLNSNSVLFWDEPETNMNPQMIFPLVKAIVELAKLGVQVFITTHDYFMQQYLNMFMAYPEINKDNIDIRFLSLYKDSSDPRKVLYESAPTIDLLTRNTITEEFDAIYDREQGIIYDRIGK